MRIRPLSWLLAVSIGSKGPSPSTWWPFLCSGRNAKHSGVLELAKLLRRLPFDFRRLLLAAEWQEPGLGLGPRTLARIRTRSRPGHRKLAAVYCQYVTFCSRSGVCIFLGHNYGLHLFACSGFPAFPAFPGFVACGLRHWPGLPYLLNNKTLIVAIGRPLRIRRVGPDWREAKRTAKSAIYFYGQNYLNVRFTNYLCALTRPSSCTHLIILSIILMSQKL